VDTLFLVGTAALVCLVWSALALTGWVTRTSEDRRYRSLDVLLWTIGLAPVVIGLVGVPASELEGTLENSSSGAAGPAGALANIVVLLLCAGIIFARLVRKDRIQRSPVLVGALVFFAGIVAASIFGTGPAFFRGVLILPLCLVAVAILPVPDHLWLADRLKKISLVYVYSALILAVVWPEKVVSGSYDSILGLPQVRLLGLVFQGNILGPIAGLAIFAILRTPRTSLRWVHLGSAFLVLFFAQGKTAWAATLMGLLFLWAYNTGSLTRRNVRLGAAALLFMFVGYQAFFAPVAQQRVQMLSTSGQDLTSLNGRTYVWDVTIDVWEENRVFGYGPTIWSTDFRAKYGEFFAFAGQAHNQFVQSLGESGLVGLGALIFYILCMLLVAVRTAEGTRGLSLACFALVAVRLMTEAALRTYRVDAAFMLHLFLAYMLMVSWNERSEPVVEESEVQVRRRVKEPVPAV
jgi:exopolysaccharide production protein ExoQ